MDYVNGYAFILEGDTEKEFYLSFLSYLCKKYDIELNRIVDKDDPDIVYEFSTEKGRALIKFNTVNTVTQMPRAGKWFNMQCAGKYNSSCVWNVFLCYDTDDYKADITKFYEGDWENLRSSLKKADKVIDVAAAADIEDVMLGDLPGICNFLGCAIPTELRGAKGKSKLKKLYRESGFTYHEGKRARPLIDSLDMEVLISTNKVALSDIETLMFK